MDQRDSQPDRRRRGLIRVGLGGAAALIAPRARASPTVAKADVSYQFTPHGDQRCGLCASFLPGVDAAGPGACKVVAGPIPPNGWCVLFSKA